jgi:CubicO group peptidase (beta-lactamase class C family)
MKYPAHKFLLNGYYLIGLALVGFPCFVLAQGTEHLDLAPQQLHQIDSVCHQQLSVFHYPGLAIGVTYQDKGIWTNGYGYSHLEEKKRVDPNEDLFRIGSISKSITAMAMARLVEENKINLDVPISTYYKELPADKSMLTLRQIGGHLAGIRHYTGFEFFSNLHYNNVIDPLEVFIHDSLEFAPGSRYGYSTYGWTLISAVMEKATGIPFLQIMDQEVMNELKVWDLKADQVDSLRYPRVGFYEYQDSTFKPSLKVDISNKWAGGGFLCTADELLRIGHALIHPGYLQTATIKTFTESQQQADGQVTNYGIGIRTGKDQKGRSWFGHSGGSIGGTSMMLVYPEEDLVIVTLVNLTSANMDNLAWKIADIVLDDSKDH